MNPEDYFLKQKKKQAATLNKTRSKQPSPKPMTNTAADGTKTITKKLKGRVGVNSFGNFVTKYKDGGKKLGNN